MIATGRPASFNSQFSPNKSFSVKKFHVRACLSSILTCFRLPLNCQHGFTGCGALPAGSNILTTRPMGIAAYLDIANGEITSIWNVRAACSNNLFPANGVLNIPNLSGGCTCNYMPVRPRPHLRAG